MSDTSAALDRMLTTAPVEWWRYVPCGYCNAPRQEPCSGPWNTAPRPHVRRMRLGLAIHATVWLLANGFEADVLGKEEA